MNSLIRHAVIAHPPVAAQSFCNKRGQSAASVGTDGQWGVGEHTRIS